MAWTLARRRYRRNVDTLRRSPLAEISGACGDLGTLLPLLTALAAQDAVSLASSLVFSGLFNIATGLVFGIPLPVQPMKAIAAAALADPAGAPLRVTVAAGALVSAAVLLLAATGLLRALAAAVPVPVVKGIQLGAGLSLTISAGATLLRPLPWGVPSWSASWPDDAATTLLDNRVWAVAAFGGLLLTGAQVSSSSETGTRKRSGGVVFPYALVTFLVGVVLAVARLALGPTPPTPSPAPFWHPHIIRPRFAAGAAWSMAVAQLPLTTLNSVVAVQALGRDLFPADHPSVTALGTSVGAMNLVGCWFGALPVCHGAGGLAAQYRFGARSGASVVLLGLAKLALGLVGGDALAGVLRAFPKSLLGVLVLAAGLELALAGVTGVAVGPEVPAVPAEADDDNDAVDAGTASTPSPDDRARWTVLLVTAAGLLAFQNDAVGCAAGLLCHGAYRLADRRDAVARRQRPRQTDGEREALLG